MKEYYLQVKDGFSLMPRPSQFGGGLAPRIWDKKVIKDIYLVLYKLPRSAVWEILAHGSNKYCEAYLDMDYCWSDASTYAACLHMGFEIRRISMKSDDLTLDAINKYVSDKEITMDTFICREHGEVSGVSLDNVIYCPLCVKKAMEISFLTEKITPDNFPHQRVLKEVN